MAQQALAEESFVFNQKVETDTVPVLKKLVLDDQAGNPVNVWDYIDVASTPYTVVVMWATWCPPCKKEIPYLNDLKNKIPNLKIVSVAINSPVEDLTDAGLDKLPTRPDYSFLSDPNGDVTNAFGFKSIPDVVVFDSDGHYLGKMEKQGPEVQRGEVITHNPLIDEFRRLTSAAGM